jgi:hypothetical protein
MCFLCICDNDYVIQTRRDLVKQGDGKNKNLTGTVFYMSINNQMLNKLVVITLNFQGHLTSCVHFAVSLNQRKATSPFLSLKIRFNQMDKGHRHK